MKKILVIILLFIGITSSAIAANIQLKDKNNGMLVRISEIEIYPQYLNEYLIFAKEVAEISIKKEKDVISIYPMMLIKDNNQIRILEIYKNEEAYKKHIASEHFQKYKKSTLHMVKSLELADTYQISEKNFGKIFKRK